MQQAAEKRKRTTTSGVRYMDIIGHPTRSSKTSKTPKTTRKAAVIQATRLTTSVYNNDRRSTKTVERVELRAARKIQPPKKTAPAPKPTPAPKPRPEKKEYPFISSVNVDKRPLSPYVPKNSTGVSQPTKNVYSATKPIKNHKKPASQKSPKTTVIERPKKSGGLSLVIIIIITIILGAAAGIGAYLILPH